MWRLLQHNSNITSAYVLIELSSAPPAFNRITQAQIDEQIKKKSFFLQKESVHNGFLFMVLCVFFIVCGCVCEWCAEWLLKLN